GWLASNYSLVLDDVQTDNAEITARGVTIKGMAANNKTYDGNTDARLTGGLLNTGIEGETLTFIGQSGTFVDKNAANGIVVNVTGIELVGNGADGAGNVNNYHLEAQPTVAAANITKQVLTAKIAAQNKVYDGETNAIAEFTVVDGLVGNETVTATGVATFNTKDVTTANVVKAESIELADGENGWLASNYSLVLDDVQTDNAEITARGVTIKGMAANNKTYDGNTNATLKGGFLQGVIEGEAITFTGQSGTFADKNAANGIAVSANISLEGTGSVLASNYSLTQPTLAVANITKKAVTIKGMAANNKTYDGNTNATLKGGFLQGVIDGEELTFTRGSGTFEYKNAANGIAVSADNATLQGTGSVLATNYSLTQPTVAVANITQKAVTITGMAAINKTYDGNAQASLTGGLLNTGIEGEALTFTGQSGTFADKNAANGIAVTVANTTLVNGSGLASNYSLTQPTAAAANITPKALAITGMAAINKTYDGSTVAWLTGGLLNTGIEGEALTFTGQSGTFADKNAANGIAVTVANTTLVNGSGLASNYSLTQPTVEAANINAMVEASSQVYDGTLTAAPVFTVTIQNVIKQLVSNVLSLAGDSSSTARVIPGPSVMMSNGNLGSPLQVIKGGIRLPENLPDLIGEDKDA
ncbi:MAG: hypothetical protein ACI910_000313, partial [Oleispira sp.]